jgi:hypothetical protein
MYLTIVIVNFIEKKNSTISCLKDNYILYKKGIILIALKDVCCNYNTKTDG